MSLFDDIMELSGGHKIKQVTVHGIAVDIDTFLEIAKTMPLDDLQTKINILGNGWYIYSACRYDICENVLHKVSLPKKKKDDALTDRDCMRQLMLRAERCFNKEEGDLL